jgi:hypothetical protein
MTSTSSPTDAATLRSAFRDVHAARLHGFALLVTCGDGEAAAHLTNAVLGAHASRIAVERHPERAAAALRAELLRRARRLRRPDVTDADRATTLRALNVDASAAEALGRLGVAPRAALVAADVERFAPEDVAMILNSSAASARRMVRAARRHYIAAHPGPPPGVVGPIRARIAEIAARALGSAEAERS